MSYTIVRDIVIRATLDTSRLYGPLARARMQSSMTTRAIASDMGRATTLMERQILTLGTTVAFTVMKMGQVLREFEKEATFAALADGAEGFQGRLVGVTRESKVLSRALKVPITDLARLERTVAELGAPETERGGIARAAVMLSRFGGDAEETAKTIYRLTKATTGPNGLVYGYEQTASAIRVAGAESAAGSEGLLAFIRTFQSAGAIAGFGTAELIAFTATIADMDETIRESARSATLRILTQEFPEAQAAFGDALNMSTEDMQELIRTNPAEFFHKLAIAVDEAKRSGQDMIVMARELGFENQRDLNLIGLLASNFEKYETILGEVNGQLGEADGATELTRQYNIQLRTLDSRLQDLGASFQRAAESVGKYLLPVMIALLEVGAGLLDIFDESPILSFAAAVGILTVSILALKRGLGFLGLGKLFGGGGMAAGSRTSDLRAIRAAIVSNDAEQAVVKRGIPGLHKALQNPKLKPGQAERLHFILAKRKERLVELGIQRAELDAGMRAAMPGPGGRGIFSGANAYIKGQLGGGIFGRVAGSRAAGLLGGPVGIIITAVSMLAPVFERLADSFKQMSETGGFVGMIFRLLATTFEAIALVGNTINLVFDAIWAVLSKILAIFNPVWNGMSGVNGGVGDLLSQANAAVKGGSERVNAWGKGVVVAPTFNMQDPQEAQRTTAAMAQRAAFGLGG